MSRKSERDSAGDGDRERWKERERQTVRLQTDRDRETKRQIESVRGSESKMESMSKRQRSIMTNGISITTF